MTNLNFDRFLSRPGGGKVVEQRFELQVDILFVDQLESWVRVGEAFDLQLTLVRVPIVLDAKIIVEFETLVAVLDDQVLGAHVRVVRVAFAVDCEEITQF